MASNLLVLLLAMFSAVAVCCAPQPHPRRTVLADQILTPYPGRSGLVYRHCAEYDAKAACSKVELTEYALEDPAVRRRLLAANIACWVGPDLYVPCEDENALCYYAKGKRPFLGIIGKKPDIEKRISFESDYATLLEARTVCGSTEILESLRELAL